MSKYVYDENYERFDVGEALTISKGKWSDGNPTKANRVGLFVALENDENEVSIASSDSYICGVTVVNDVFLGFDKDDAAYCVVQSLGICVIQDDGSLAAGDKCMPSNDGTAIKSSNELGFRVVGRVDSNHIRIIMSPNNDMIQRIKSDVEVIEKVLDTAGEVNTFYEQIWENIAPTEDYNTGEFTLEYNEGIIGFLFAVKNNKEDTYPTKQVRLDLSPDNAWGNNIRINGVVWIDDTLYYAERPIAMSENNTKIKIGQCTYLENYENPFTLVDEDTLNISDMSPKGKLANDKFIPAKIYAIRQKTRGGGRLSADGVSAGKVPMAKGDGTWEWSDVSAIYPDGDTEEY